MSLTRGTALKTHPLELIMTRNSHVTRRLRAMLARAVLALALTMVMWPGVASTKPGSPEDIEWRLVKLGDTTVPLLPGHEQPSLLLDSVHMRATGYAGCNNFFSSYKRSGSTLRFGPVGSTRKACPEVPSNVESNYFAVLSRTREWRIEEGELLLLASGNVLARFTSNLPYAALFEPEGLTLRSTVYTAAPVHLSHGEYHAPAAPGSASQIMIRLTALRAFATLAGRERGVVVLETSTGGSGTFYELALLARRADRWVNTDTLLLGDRVKVHFVAFENDAVIVAMTVHGPKDPQCCPTQEVRKRFTIRGDRLVAVNKGEAGVHADEPDPWLCCEPSLAAERVDCAV